ncbi:MAG: DMT family transporter [Alphaproteobacteria bacterium]|nr:DMT family transporter [Alphaproteobacteria bacterium]
MTPGRSDATPQRRAGSGSAPAAPDHDRIPASALMLLALMTVFWGINFPIMKLALAEIEPWTFRVACLGIGAIGLFAIAAARGQTLVPARAERRALVLVSLLNITGWHLFSAFGLALMGAGRAAILAYTMPLWAMLAARMILGEKLTAARVLGLVLGFGGMLVLFGAEIEGIGAAPWGALCMLAAAVSWGAGTGFMKAHPWRMTATVLTGWQMAIGGVPVLVGFFFVGRPPAAAGISATAWLALAYATTIPMVFCHYAWTRLVGLVPAGAAAIGTLAIPVIGVISSAPMTGEAVGPREVLALGLVLAALSIVLVLPARDARAAGFLAGSGRSRLPDRGRS